MTFAFRKLNPIRERGGERNVGVFEADVRPQDSDRGNKREGGLSDVELSVGRGVNGKALAFWRVQGLVGEGAVFDGDITGCLHRWGRSKGASIVRIRNGSGCCFRRYCFSPYRNKQVKEDDAEGAPL